MNADRTGGGNLPVPPEPPSPDPLARARRSASESRPLRVWVDMTASAKTTASPVFARSLPTSPAPRTG